MLHVFELLLLLELQFVLELDLRLVVQPVVNSLFAALASWLRIGQLWVARVLLFFDFAPDLLMPEVLSEKECLLVRKELIFGAALLTLSLQGHWLEARFLIILFSFLLHTLLLKSALPV